MADSRVIFWIPAYNEEKSIPAVVSGLLDAGEVVVFDDCSEDRTTEVAITAGATVVENKTNCGYEFAISAGKEYAMNNDFDILVTLDADGQHCTADIKKVLHLLQENKDSCAVIGVRQVFQRFSEKFFSIISKRSIGLKDPMSGLKAYRVSALRLCNCNLGDLVGSQVLVNLFFLQCNIREVEINIAPRLHGSSRFGARISGELKILRALAIFLKNYFVGYV